MDAEIVSREGSQVTLQVTVDIGGSMLHAEESILDANIEYTGNGVISDKQKPGWMVRILDNVWPF